MDVLIGVENGEHVLIRLFGGGDPNDYWWISGEVSISAGAFSGSFPASFRSPDFPPFREQLETLFKTLEGIATFTTLEGQLELEFRGDGLGHIVVTGTARDNAGTGNLLNFETGFDQTYLPAIVAALKRVEAEFPVEQG